jgi:hypothetical protein
MVHISCSRAGSHVRQSADACSESKMGNSQAIPSRRIPMDAILSLNLDTTYDIGLTVVGHGHGPTWELTKFSSSLHRHMV